MSTTPINAMINHLATYLMHRYQQKGKSLQKSNFEFSLLIQTVSNCELNDITDLFKIYMYAQKLINLAIRGTNYLACTLNHPESYRLCKKIERESLLVEGIQQAEFDVVMSIDVSAGNDPMNQQTHKHVISADRRVITKDCPNYSGTNPGPDQNMSAQP